MLNTAYSSYMYKLSNYMYIAESYALATCMYIVISHFVFMSSSIIRETVYFTFLFVVAYAFSALKDIIWEFLAIHSVVMAIDSIILAVATEAHETFKCIKQSNTYGTDLLNANKE